MQCIPRIHRCLCKKVLTLSASAYRWEQHNPHLQYEETLCELEGILSLSYGLKTMIITDNALLLPSLARAQHVLQEFFSLSLPVAVLAFIFLIPAVSRSKSVISTDTWLYPSGVWPECGPCCPESEAESTSWWRDLTSVTWGIMCLVETCIPWAMWGRCGSCVGSAVALRANREGSACLCLLLLVF